MFNTKLASSILNKLLYFPYLTELKADVSQARQSGSNHSDIQDISARVGALQSSNEPDFKLLKERISKLPLTPEVIKVKKFLELLERDETLTQSRSRWAPPSAKPSSSYTQEEFLTKSHYQWNEVAVQRLDKKPELEEYLHRVFDAVEEKLNALERALKSTPSDSAQYAKTVEELQAHYRGAADPFGVGFDFSFECADLFTGKFINAVETLRKIPHDRLEELEKKALRMKDRFDAVLSKLPKPNECSSEEMRALYLHSLKAIRAEKGGEGPSVAIEGAGPAGLMHAIVAYLEGAKNVTLIEKRGAYTRDHNILFLDRKSFEPWVNFLGLQHRIPHFKWTSNGLPHSVLAGIGALHGIPTEVSPANESCVQSIADIERALRSIVDELGIEVCQNEVVGVDDEGHLILEDESVMKSDVIIAAGGKQSAIKRTAAIKTKELSVTVPLLAATFGPLSFNPLHYIQNLLHLPQALLGKLAGRLTAFEGVKLLFPSYFSPTGIIIWLGREREDRYLFLPLELDQGIEVEKLTAEQKKSLAKFAAPLYFSYGRELRMAEIFNTTVTQADESYVQMGKAACFIVGDASQTAAPEAGVGALTAMMSARPFALAYRQLESGKVEETYNTHLLPLQKNLVESSLKSRKEYIEEVETIEIRLRGELAKCLSSDQINQLRWLMLKLTHAIPFNETDHQLKDEIIDVLRRGIRSYNAPIFRGVIEQLNPEISSKTPVTRALVIETALNQQGAFYLEEEEWKQLEELKNLCDSKPQQNALEGLIRERDFERLSVEEVDALGYLYRRGCDLFEKISLYARKHIFEDEKVQILSCSTFKELDKSCRYRLQKCLEGLQPFHAGYYDTIYYEQFDDILYECKSEAY